MRFAITIAAAGILTLAPLAGTSFAQSRDRDRDRTQDRDDNARTASDRQKSRDRNEIRQRNRTRNAERSANVQQVYRTLGLAVNRAMSPGGNQSMLEYVASTDRNRIKRELDRDASKEYDQVVRDFRDSWKDKYGKDFDLTANTDALEGHDIEFTDNGDKAVVTIRGAEEAQDFQIHLTRAGGGSDEYRISLPDKIDAEKFQNDFVGAIKRLENRRKGLPSDVQDGYDMVTWMLLRPLAYNK
jgi:hypothetical protein